MKVIVCKDYDEMSIKAAEFIAEEMNKKKNFVLGLATGSTPVGTYKNLIRMNTNKEI
ncbi:MAG TPA: glucosamine-6-phosphate deaminase, partial [Clostridia bacterium]|nr:glucosamine-6-phosphate deaminase [Clostridia bacterium]